MGCQMNEYDSDYLGRLLLEARYSQSETPTDADLILINTCAVRAKAEQKAYSLLGRMLALKKKKPSLVLGMVGCIAQQEGAMLTKRFPGLDFVLGTREIGKILEVLNGLGAAPEKNGTGFINDRTMSFLIRPGYFEGRVKSFISIMEGCNNFCSYCIVPYVRGREVSRRSGQVLEEAEHLVSEGVKEVTLLGQNVNSYRCPSQSFRFPTLLNVINRIEGLARVRFTTSHPKDLSEDLVQCFDRLEKLCPHIHLPIQAGSNRILKLMNRKYTREAYIERVERLREVRPDIAVTTDVIVGFPGESDEDFNMTLDLLKKIEFDGIFSFRYSDRPKTLAEKMDHKVDEKVKIGRLYTLQNLQKAITLKKNEALIGRELEILVDGYSKKGGQFTGRTGSNKIVNFICDNNYIGNIIKVKIKQASVNSLGGELPSEKKNRWNHGFK
jgi:tRNA-2-methylthio-N6-dimethylallyladenosine synthase